MILEQVLSVAPAPDPIWTKPLPTGQNTSYLYPIFIIIGFVVAIVLSCLKMWKRYKISIEPFYWFILIGVPVSIFGANFGSCVLGRPAGKDWSEFWTSFGTGLAIEWGIMFCILAACIYFPLILKMNRYRVRDEFTTEPQVRKVSMWMYFDAIMPCVLIAQFLGRWGNYFNQEVYGAVVTSDSLSWFLHNCLPGMWIGDAWRQPLFLWEGLGNLAMFFVLYFGVEAIRIRKTGDLAACYLVWYGAFRACLEPLREQSYKSSTSIVLSIIFCVIGVVFILINHLVVARLRDKKVFSIIIRKPIQAWNKMYYPAKINKLSHKLTDANNPEKAQAIQTKLDAYKSKWESLSIKYQSNDWQAKFVRTNAEKLYFGRW